MYQQDFVKRLIAQATRALLKILGLIEQRNYPMALVEIDWALQEMFGLTLTQLRQLPVGALLALARLPSGYDWGRLTALAELSEAEAQALHAQNQTDLAHAAQIRALQVWLALAGDVADDQLPSLEPRLTQLNAALHAVELPNETALALSHFHDRLDGVVGSG